MVSEKDLKGGLVVEYHKRGFQSYHSEKEMELQKQYCYIFDNQRVFLSQ